VANDKAYVLPAVIFGSVLRSVEKGRRWLVPICCHDGAVGPTVNFSKQVSFESETLRFVSDCIVSLSLYFLQLSEHVGPKIEDFAVEPF
jgi:hypothetical protein